MTAEVVPLPVSPLRDIPEMLRQWADAIEAGEHGTAHSCVLVLDAGRLEVAFFGDGEASLSAHFLLHAGAAVMMRRVMKERT